MKPISNFIKSGDYREQIKSPAWKQFSKRIREDRGNFCQMCKRSDVTTQVHHWFYEPGRDLWEYKGEEVIVLCYGCHQQIHEHLSTFRKHVFTKMNPAVFRILNGALSVAFDQYDPLVFAHALAEFVSTPSMVQRYASAWGRTASKETEEEKAYKTFKIAMTGDITGKATMLTDPKLIP